MTLPSSLKFIEDFFYSLHINFLQKLYINLIFTPNVFKLN